MSREELTRAQQDLGTCADGLDAVPRINRGGKGEGAKVIEMSDELARKLAARLREIARGL